MYKPPRIPEKTEQAHGVQLLRRLGADVWVLGTRRPKGDFQGTRQTPGIADVFAVLPTSQITDRFVGGIIYTRRALWWECKAKGGRLRPEQKHFKACCQQADLWHVVGTFDALIDALMVAGYLPREDVAHYRIG